MSVDEECDNAGCCPDMMEKKEYEERRDLKNPRYEVLVLQEKFYCRTGGFGCSINKHIQDSGGNEY